MMVLSIRTRLKNALFELHHGRKSRTELTYIVLEGNTYLSNWSEIAISVQHKPKVPIFRGRDADGEMTNHMVMARTNVEDRQNEGSESKLNNFSLIFFSVCRKEHNKKSPEERFQNQIQTAIGGTQNSVKPDLGNLIRRVFISGPLF